MTPEDQAFFDRYGDVFFEVHTRQFSHDDLSKILFPDTMLKLGNWIAAGYVKPDYYKDPRGGPDRRRYSIVEITRIIIIDSLVNGIGLKPSQAAQVADFGIPFLNDTIERHPDHTLKSTAHIYIASWLNREDGRIKSTVYYRKLEGDPHLYLDDPYLNPDAKPHAPFAGTAIHLPLTDVFKKIFIECAKFLVINKRGGVDKFRRPVDV